MIILELEMRGEKKKISSCVLYHPLDMREKKDGK